MEWHRKNFDSERRSPPNVGFPCGNPKGSERGNFARPANKHPIRRKINPPVSLGQIPKATPSGLFPADGVFSARHAAVRQAFDAQRMERSRARLEASIARSQTTAPRIPAKTKKAPAPPRRNSSPLPISPRSLAPALPKTMRMPAIASAANRSLKTYVLFISFFHPFSEGGGVSPARPGQIEHPFSFLVSLYRSFGKMQGVLEKNTNACSLMVLFCFITLFFHRHIPLVFIKKKE